jgi:hypothetical protein
MEVSTANIEIYTHGAQRSIRLPRRKIQASGRSLISLGRYANIIAFSQY